MKMQDNPLLTVKPMPSPGVRQCTEWSRDDPSLHTIPEGVLMMTVVYSG